MLRAQWPEASRIAIVCGTGNNGGDGYVVASLALQAGLQPQIWQVGDASRIQGDALTARRRALEEGVDIRPFSGEALQGDVIVDALLGTGLSGEVRGESARAIAAINASAVPVLAIDIPSGLCADSGSVLGDAVRAACTITFIGMKQGLLTGMAADHCGDLYYARLDVPDAVFAAVPVASRQVKQEHIARWLPPRPRHAHKGHHGHVLIIGGDHGMGGAAAMAAEAAGRVGAGLVTVVTRPEHVSAILARRPECMVLASTDLGELLQRATVVVAGPGLGQGEW